MTDNNSYTSSGNEGMEYGLWNFIDGSVKIDEKTVIEKLLQTDASWKAKYNELLQVKRSVEVFGT